MRRVFALLVSLLLLLPAGSVSAQAFFCHMRGKLSSACCCEKARAQLAADDAQPGGPAAQQGDCCEDRALTASGERRSMGSSDVPVVPAAVVIGVLPVELLAELRAPSAEPAPSRARAPPPRALAPLYILNRAFLS